MTVGLLKLIGWYSRPDGDILIEELQGSFSFGDLRRDVGFLGQILMGDSGPLVLYSVQPRCFLTALIAGILSRRDILLPGLQGWRPTPGDGSASFRFLGDAHQAGYESIDDLIVQGNAEGMEELTQPVVSGASDTLGKIIFLTSGSTGEAKQIRKSYRMLETEMAVLSRLWGEDFASSLVCTTVSHQHLYGILFASLLPITAGGRIYAEKIEYPEAFQGLPKGKKVLVSSPAFLSRLSELENIEAQGFQAVFSSGGPLLFGDAKGSEKVFAAPVMEIFGSTETGGIAHRRITASKEWKFFEGIEVSLLEGGRLVIRSDYLESREPYETSDLAVLGSQGVGGGFQLLGRSDSVVKIEEKRVSLDAMVEATEEVPWVHRARFIPLSGNRQSLGGVILPDEAHMQRVIAGESAALGKELRQMLSAHFPLIVVPRRWRFLSAMPMNDMGKVSHSDLDRLFGKKDSDFRCDVLALNSGTGLLECILQFPAKHRFFQGHFPEQPILPGVAQAYTVLQLAGRYLDFEYEALEIPRLKFSHLVEPNDILRLRLEMKDGGKGLSYWIKLHPNGKTVSTGKINFLEGQNL